MKVISDALGKTIAHYRHEADITQAKLAFACGVAQQTIGNIETGRIEPSLRLLCSIAIELNVTPNDLLGWDIS